VFVLVLASAMRALRCPRSWGRKVTLVFCRVPRRRVRRATKGVADRAKFCRRAEPESCVDFCEVSFTLMALLPHLERKSPSIRSRFPRRTNEVTLRCARLVERREGVERLIGIDINQMRVVRLELTGSAWKAGRLPLTDTRSYIDRSDSWRWVPPTDGQLMVRVLRLFNRSFLWRS
jgi:hypothetical protein